MRAQERSSGPNPPRARVTHSTTLTVPRMYLIGSDWGAAQGRTPAIESLRFEEVGQPAGACQPFFRFGGQFTFLHFGQGNNLLCARCGCHRLQGLLPFDPHKEVIGGGLPPVGHVQVEGLGEPGCGF